jgi:hypothetical protein
MPSEFDVESFIVSSFRSVWALDLVRILLADTEKGFSPDELVRQLRASDAVVQQCVGALSSAGLVVIEHDRIRLHIANDQARELLKAAVELYRKRPDRVRRLIIAAASPGLTAFADAFRLRKD